MARPKKCGLDYMSMDIDFFQSRTIRYISSLYQSRGIAITIMLLTDIYRKGYFLVWDKITRQVFIDSLPRDCDGDLLDKVISDLIQVNFFNNDCYFGNNVLTSENIQLRYFSAKEKKVFDVDTLEYILIDRKLIKKSYKENQLTKGNENQECVIPEITTKKRIVISKNKEIIPESKVKESKVNNNKKERNSKETNTGNPFEAEYELAKNDTTNYNYNGLVDTMNNLNINHCTQSRILAISHYGRIGDPIWTYIKVLPTQKPKVKDPGAWLIKCMENHHRAE